MTKRIVEIYKDYALDRFKGYPNSKSRAQEWVDRYFDGRGGLAA